MRFKLLIISTLLLFSCHKKEKFENVQLIGHAGAGLNSSTSPYCENSQNAVNYAASMEGIQGVEIDIQCSASNTMWLYHDEYLENATNGEGCVNSVTDAYLEELKYSGWGNERPIRLSDLNFPYTERKLFLDVRAANLCTNQIIDQQTVIQAIEAALNGKPFTEVYVVTNYTPWVHAFYLKGWKVYLNVPTVAEYLDDPVMLETTGLCIRSSEISKDQVEEVKQEGKEVVIFEVRSPKGIRQALKKYPDYLMTDNLKAAIIEKYP